MKRIHLGVAAGFLILSFILTYPLSCNLGTTLPGEHDDSYFHIWNYWWFHQALVEEGRDVMFSPYVLYPTGCELTMHSYSLTNSMLSLAGTGWLGLVPTYNLIIIGGFFGAAMAMYWLAFELTGSWPGSVAAGFIFGFSPFHYQHLSRPDNAGIMWLPLAVLYLLRIWRRPRFIDGLWLAAFFVLASYSSWYFMVSLTLFAGLVGSIFLLADPRRIINRKALGAGLAAVLLSAVLLAPALLPMLAIKQRGNFGSTSLAIHARIATDPVALVTPSPFHPLATDAIRDAYRQFAGTEKIAFLGIGVLVLAALGVMAAPRRTRWLWLTIAGTFLVLSLGPLWHWRGTFYDIPLPYAVLYKLFPPIRAARAPIRLLVFVYMALAVFAAFAFRRPRVKSRLLPLLLALVVFEYLAIPYPVDRLSVPEVYHRIAAEPGEFAVLEVPVTDYPTVLQYYQTIHQHPIPMGAVTHIPPWRFAFLGSYPVIRELVNPSLITPERQAELAGHGDAYLTAAGFRYLVFHPELINPPAARARIRDFIETVLVGPLTEEPEGIWVYRLPDKG